MAMLAPVLSKQFCANTRLTFVVRKRPPCVNGGGFVVTNNNQDLAFRTEAWGIIGCKGELILRDSNGIAVFLIRKKAMSFHKQWRAYSLDYEGVEKMMFFVKEPVLCFAKKCSLKVQLATIKSSNDWDFEINGSFTDRECTITDYRGQLVAEVRARNAVGMIVSKDLYYVIIQPGYDQAFVFGIVAILDNIYET